MARHGAWCLLLTLRFGTATLLPDSVQKGVAFGAGQWSVPTARFDTPDSDDSLQQLALTGASHVRIMVAEYQDYANSTSIYAIQDPSPLRSSTQAEVLHAIQKAHELKLRVFLSPVLDINWDKPGNRQAAGVEGSVSRAQIGVGFSSDQWDAWFAAYEEFILRYAQLAADGQVELLALGSNLDEAFRQEQRWRALITKVRAKCPDTQLTLSTSTGFAGDVKFWDALDYIGTGGYHSLSEGGASSSDVPELIKAWAKPLESLGALSSQFGKLVLITEAGYQSRPHCWETPAHSPRGGGGSDCSAWPRCFNLQCQADGYEALFLAFSEQPWFAGVYWWLWRSDPSAWGTASSDFTPRGKPAEQVLTRWFGGMLASSPAPAPTPAKPQRPAPIRQNGKLVRNGYVFGISDWSGSRLAANSSAAFASVDEAIAAGVNALEIPAMWYIVNRTDTKILPITDPNSDIRSTDDEELKALLRYAAGKGLRVALSPMIDPQCQGAADPKAECFWRAESGTNFTDAQWEEWFVSYHGFIVHYARLAGELGTDVVAEFHVSHELNTPELNAPLHLWQNLMSDVRAVFKGQVAVALNWGPYIWPDPKNPGLPEWVKSVDYIGIDCYFPVTVDVSPLPWQMPTLDSLLQAWQPYVQALEAYSVAAGNKPMVCTEVGYQSRPFSFLNPAGRLQLNEPDCSVWDQCVSIDSQALAYEALFQSLYPKSWFEGFYLWLWRADPTAGGTSDDDFTPQRKPATLKVLEKWWKQPQPTHEQELVV